MTQEETALLAKESPTTIASRRHADNASPLSTSPARVNKSFVRPFWKTEVFPFFLKAFAEIPSRVASPRTMRRPLVFFHIGKTGGTSLIKHLQSATARVFVEKSPFDTFGIDAALAGEELDFISGHYQVAPTLARLPPDWFTMTVIRDPYRHLTSTYWHIRAHPPDTTEPALKRLIDACSRCDFAALLAGPREESFETHFDNPQTRAVVGKRHGPIGRRDLAHAIKLLSRLSFVGTTDHIDCLAAHIAASLPWASSVRCSAMPYVMVNPHNRSGAIDVRQSTMLHISALTELDAELYRHACALSPAPQPPEAIPAAMPRPRALPIADLARVFPHVLAGARAGEEFRIDTDTLLLHPPHGRDGAAMLHINDIPLEGHDTFSGRLVLGHPAAAPVRFTIRLAQGEIELLDATFLVSATNPIDFTLAFTPSVGPGVLRLQTEMGSCEAKQSFAWARFVNLVIS
jgi:hypothetical protein